MPRRSLLTPAERTGLFVFPTSDDELIRHYTFSEQQWVCHARIEVCIGA